MQVSDQITLVKNIAERLKHARERLDPVPTQDEVAKKAGVSQGTIGNIESGARKSPRELLAIAKALGVNPQWLKTGEGAMIPSQQGGATSERPPTLESALPVVLDAISRCSERAELERLLPLLVTGAPLYRQRLAELLTSVSGTAAALLAKTAQFETKGVTAAPATKR
jgi:transcriptional regulator with XRE-family HTH domain